MPINISIFGSRLLLFSEAIFTSRGVISKFWAFALSLASPSTSPIFVLDDEVAATVFDAGFKVGFNVTFGVGVVVNFGVDFGLGVGVAGLCSGVIVSVGVSVGISTGVGIGVGVGMFIAIETELLFGSSEPAPPELVYRLIRILYDPCPS
jgi:hypothetical protein